MVAAWLRALRELSKKHPEDEDFDAIQAELNSEKNDRGAALIAAAMVENNLEQAIAARFGSLNKDEYDKLFGPDAPLGSFSSKIRIGYAMGVFDAAFRNELDKLREIRNVFAHAKLSTTFETPEIAAACAQFSAPNFAFVEDVPFPRDHARYKLLTATTVLMASLVLASSLVRAGRREPLRLEDWTTLDEILKRAASLEKSN